MTKHAVGLTRVFIAVGSNMGDRARLMSEAIGLLSSILETVRVASFYETLPREVVDQPPFLNTVVAARTALSPEELLAKTCDIEKKLGRVRDEDRPKGPRPIDLDILLYGTQVIQSEKLCVPHPRMIERKFVLIPLVEIDPCLRHPATGRRFQTYLDALQPQGIYYFLPTSYSRIAANLRR